MRLMARANVEDMGPDDFGSPRTPNNKDIFDMPHIKSCPPMPIHVHSGAGRCWKYIESGTFAI